MIKRPSTTEFESAFIKNFDFKPTTDQKYAIGKLSSFITSISEYEIFVLTGYAGTGKTTLISKLIKTLNDNAIKSVSLAPTGRAAKVLSSYSNEKATTIHRKIYFQDIKADQAMSFNTGKNLHKNTIFLVDEASMISSSAVSERDLLHDLVEYVYSSENCKLIFIGDVGQLPPIGSNESPALSVNHL